MKTQTAKHTQESWSYFIQKADTYPNKKRDVAYIESDGGRMVVAIIDPAPSEDVLNLIVSAPELLEALTEKVRQCSYCFGSGKRSAIYGEMKCASCSSAIGAISKAEGRP